MQRAFLLTLIALAAGAGSGTFSGTARAAAMCGHAWAEPGLYKITGNFRGSPESAGAELTRDCRIELKIPGVFTGGPVKADGKCIRFTFKISNEDGLFKGRWCDRTATVDWKGRNVEASITKVRQGGKSGRIN